MISHGEEAAPWTSRSRARPATLLIRHVLIRHVLIRHVLIRPRADQTTVQGTPLRVKAVGSAVLPVWVAWKPMSMVAPGAIVPL